MPATSAQAEAGSAVAHSAPAHRPRRKRGGRRKPKLKPYSQMTWEEKLEAEERALRRAAVAASRAPPRIPRDQHGRVKEGVAVQHYAPPTPMNSTLDLIAAHEGDPSDSDDGGDSSIDGDMDGVDSFLYALVGGGAGGEANGGAGARLGAGAGLGEGDVQADAGDALEAMVEAEVQQAGSSGAASAAAASVPSAPLLAEWSPASLQSTQGHGPGPSSASSGAVLPTSGTAGRRGRAGSVDSIEHWIAAGTSAVAADGGSAVAASSTGAAAAAAAAAAAVAADGDYEGAALHALPHDALLRYAHRLLLQRRSLLQRALVAESEVSLLRQQATRDEAAVAAAATPVSPSRGQGRGGTGGRQQRHAGGRGATTTTQPSSSSTQVHALPADAQHAGTVVDGAGAHAASAPPPAKRARLDSSSAGALGPD